MKKKIILGVLAATGFAASSFAQGYIAFTSYYANSSVGATTSFFDGPAAGTLVPAGSFTATLYYALGTVVDPVDTGSSASILSSPTGLTAIPSSALAFDTAGYFGSGTIPTVTIPGYTSGAVTFEIVVNGTYQGVNYIGRSGAFTESTIANSTSVPLTNFGDNGPGMPNMFVAAVPVPEPSTLALAGLGGFGMLMALRRKKA